jgi:hypothetical protein
MLATPAPYSNEFKTTFTGSIMPFSSKFSNYLFYELYPILSFILFYRILYKMDTACPLSPVEFSIICNEGSQQAF